MSDALVLFLPADGDDAYRWLRVADDAIADRGEGLPDEVGSDAPDGVPLVAIAPADRVTLHWAELPHRSLAQSIAAARIVVAEASATPIGDLHVAVGTDGSESDDRPVGVVATAQMERWLAALAVRGLDPQRIVPAPLLLPRPAEGYVRADFGGQGVVRGVNSGFADEGPLTELVTEGAVPVTVARDALEEAIVAAVSAPVLDLRQGPFARRRRLRLDWALIRRLGWLALAILTVTLLISLMQIVRYSVAADALEARADMLAREGLPPGATVSEPSRQLDERLAGLRGGGLGFDRTAAAVFSAVQSIPGAELTSLDFGAGGQLRVGVSVPTEAQANDLKARIEGYGLTVEAGVFQSAAGRVTGDLTVAAP